MTRPTIDSEMDQETREGDQCLPLTGIRPEEQLLLHCVRPHLDAATLQKVRTLIRKGVNWDHLIATALRHGVLPLLYTAFREMAWEGPPTAMREKLEAHYHSNKGRNVFLTDELLRILNIFEAHRVRAIPYKGPALAAVLHGRVGLRQFYDLDIMVRKRDVALARDLLISLGYRPLISPPRAHEAAFMTHECEYIFMGDNEVVLELCWAFAERCFSFSPNLREWRARLEPVSLGGKEVLTFSQEDTLLALCMHGTKHYWDVLSTICDVAQLVHVRPGMNWRRVLHQARNLGGMRMLLLGLHLASDLLVVGLPNEVSQAIQQDPQVKSLASYVCGNLFRASPNASEVDPCAFFALKARERLHDRIRYCLDLLITPTYGDWARLPLPGFLSFLHYLLRPARVLGKYGLNHMGRLVYQLAQAVRISGSEQSR